MPQPRTRVSVWLDDLFDYAFSGAARHERVVRAGSVVVSVRSEDTTDLEDMLRAFPAASRDAQVDVRLAAVNGLPSDLAATFPFRGSDIGVRGRVTTGVPADVRARIDLGEQDATFWSGDRRAGVWVMPPQLADWHWASPFRQLLHNAAATRGSALVHAAMVGGDDGCVLLVGASYSGKSTAVAMAIHAGLKTGGDDYVEVVTTAGGVPTAFPIHHTFQIRHGNTVAPRRPTLLIRTLVENAKDIHYLDSEPEIALTGGHAIRAVIAVGGAGPQGLLPISTREAILALAPSTVTQTVHDEESALAVVTALCSSVPAFRMSRPSDAGQLRDWLKPLVGADG